MKKRIGIFGFIIIAVGIVFGCRPSTDSGNFTTEEKALIGDALTGEGTLFPAGTMRVLTICDSADMTVLRRPSIDFSAEALMSDGYASLRSLMIATVTHPSQDGVGIAAPQVGLNRRVVAVQRFDKEPDYPFEVYPNVRIVWRSDSLAYGPEGCLSVPGRYGDVLRSQEVVIEYADLDALEKAAATMSPCEIRRRFRTSPLPVIRDTVKGFTAVIFQHETDHLDGVLYIDRL